jgi:hypothetical protein
MGQRIIGSVKTIKAIDKAMDECFKTQKEYLKTVSAFGAETTNEELYRIMVKANQEWHVALCHLFEVMENKELVPIDAPVLTAPKVVQPTESEPYPPWYKHDCTNCTFLGQFEEYDLYYCPQGNIPTVIARFSDDGPDYTSGLNSRLPCLQAAQMLAIEKGLLK